MTELIIIVGMLAALWSGFYIGYYKREGKAPELPALPKVQVKAKEKPERKTREQKKENAFFS